MPILNADELMTPMTTWENPKSNPNHVRFSIFLGPPTAAAIAEARREARLRALKNLDFVREDEGLDRHGAVDLDAVRPVGNLKPHTLDVDVAPGERVEIPSEYDLAVQDVRDGQIVGGFGPMLKRVDGPAFEMHRALEVPAAPQPRDLATQLRDLDRDPDDADVKPIRSVK